MVIRFPRRFCASWLAWLVAALLLAQGQGQLHAIAHGHAAAGQHAGHEAHADDRAHADDGTHDHDQFGNWLLRLFVNHDGESACRLFDQSAQGSCIPSFATLAPAFPPTATRNDFLALTQPLPAPVLVRVRGPPPVR